MAYIKLFNTESKEIRLLSARTEFDEMLAFVNEHFNIARPIFKYKDDEGDIITFSSNGELIFLKELAKNHGWNKIKINVEKNNRSSFRKKNRRQQPIQGNLPQQPDNLLKFIEQNAPTFFSPFGIECTAYREEVEIPVPSKNEDNQQDVSSLESKNDENLSHDKPTPIVDNDLQNSKKEESSLKEEEVNQLSELPKQKILMTDDDEENQNSLKQKTNETWNVHRKTENYDFYSENDFFSSEESYDFESEIQNQVENSSQNQIENSNQNQVENASQNQIENASQNQVENASQNEITNEVGASKLNESLPQEQASHQINPSPVELFQYSDELAQICSMGFEDIEKIKSCLIRSQGVMGNAIDLFFMES